MTKSPQTITVAIQSPGDMGQGVGRDLIARGFKVVTGLAGRSERSRGLAAGAGIEDVGGLADIIEAADLVLSIMPPSAAYEFADTFAATVEQGTKRPIFADCNAISPSTADRIAARMMTADIPFIDAGIVGPPPGRGDLATRFYCSGPDTGALEALDGGGMSVHRLGNAVGQASAMKMVYAAITKGTMTLHAAALITAERHGLSEAFHSELKESQSAAWAAMNRMVPRLPLDAGRWVGEMHEIADTLGAAGLPPDFHQGAAKMFEMLDRTPIALETRETVDPNRTLQQALAIYAEEVAKGD